MRSIIYNLRVKFFNWIFQIPVTEICLTKKPIEFREYFALRTNNLTIKKEKRQYLVLDTNNPLEVHDGLRVVGICKDGKPHRFNQAIVGNSGIYFAPPAECDVENLSEFWITTMRPLKIKAYWRCTSHYM